jgi:hypothetical protein
MRKMLILIIVLISIISCKQKIEPIKLVNNPIDRIDSYLKDYYLRENYSEILFNTKFNIYLDSIFFSREKDKVNLNSKVVKVVSYYSNIRMRFIPIYADLNYDDKLLFQAIGKSRDSFGLHMRAGRFSPAIVRLGDSLSKHMPIEVFSLESGLDSMVASRYKKQIDEDMSWDFFRDLFLDIVPNSVQYIIDNDDSVYIYLLDLDKVSYGKGAEFEMNTIDASTISFSNELDQDYSRANVDVSEHYYYWESGIWISASYYSHCKMDESEIDSANKANYINKYYNLLRN